jgi:hypothetical protein
MNLLMESAIDRTPAQCGWRAVRSNSETRKNLRTHLSTGSVDFSETCRMKYLRDEVAAQHEFLEDYKRDARGHSAQR